MLQCVAVCCSVLQCVAVSLVKALTTVHVFARLPVVCCSVLQRVAVCCSHASRHGPRCICLLDCLYCVAIRCSVLQFVVCSALQRWCLLGRLCEKTRPFAWHDTLRFLPPHQHVGHAALLVNSHSTHKERWPLFPKLLSKETQQLRWHVSQTTIVCNTRQLDDLSSPSNITTLWLQSAIQTGVSRQVCCEKKA